MKLFVKKDVADDLIKSHIKGYTRKDGVFVKEHDDSRKAASTSDSSASKENASEESDYRAPEEGEVGHHEHSEYGVYHRKGDTVKDGSGKEHKVMRHQGAEVLTENGDRFHPTKLRHVRNAK